MSLFFLTLVCNSSGCLTVSSDSNSPQFQFSCEHEWRKSFSQSDDLAVQPQLQVGQNIQTVI